MVRNTSQTSASRAQSAHRFVRWAPLVLILLICLPPLLVGLGDRDTTHTMENVALVVSQETWLRHHDGAPTPWYLTYNDERARIVKPPLVTWQHMLAWIDLDPVTATPDQLVYRARLMAVLMGLLLIASVFWAGLSLKDVSLAAGAALTVGTMLFFQRQARTASYDIHFAAWAALSVAAGLWAMKQGVLAEAGDDEVHPGARNPRITLGKKRIQTVIAWSIAGIALAAAVYSKNPLAYPVVLLPLAAAIIVLPGRRGRRIVGLVAAVVLSIALVLPWYLAIYDLQGAESKLSVEFAALRDKSQPIYYYLALIALLAPWSVWLVPALAHPFMDGKALGRRSRLVPWLWFILIFLLFSLHPTKQQRYILPIIPAAAVLIAFVWRDHDTIIRQGQTPGGYRGWVAIHGCSMLLVSIFFAPFLAAQHWFFTHAFPAGWIEKLDINTDSVGPLGWPIAIVATIVLLALAIYTWRVHSRREPMKALFATGVWSIVLMTVFWHVYGTSPSGHHPIKPIAMQFRAEIGDTPIRSLRVTGGVDSAYILNEEFRFYFGRRIPWIRPEELAQYAIDTKGEGLVLARQKPEHENALREAGYIPLRAVQTDDEVTQTLWRSGPP